MSGPQPLLALSEAVRGRQTPVRCAERAREHTLGQRTDLALKARMARAMVSLPLALPPSKHTCQLQRRFRHRGVGGWRTTACRQRCRRAAEPCACARDAATRNRSAARLRRRAVPARGNGGMLEGDVRFPALLRKERGALGVGARRRVARVEAGVGHGRGRRLLAQALHLPHLGEDHRSDFAESGKNPQMFFFLAPITT